MLSITCGNFLMDFMILMVFKAFSMFCRCTILSLNFTDLSTISSLTL